MGYNGSMKAMLELEAIGENSFQYVNSIYRRFEQMSPGLGDELVGKPSPHYWCAEILGLHPVYTLSRRFLQGQKDYARANRKGSRGIYVYYLLESGKLYEVKEPVSWKNTARNFYIVTPSGDIERISKEEALEWVQKNLPA